MWKTILLVINKHSINYHCLLLQLLSQLPCKALIGWWHVMDHRTIKSIGFQFNNCHCVQVHYKWQNISQWNRLVIYANILVQAHNIFPWHTLPNLDQIYAISEVIILNNDQHQHQKIIATNNRINSKIKRHHTTFVNWCYCLTEVSHQKLCLFVACKSVLLGK